MGGSKGHRSQLGKFFWELWLPRPKLEDSKSNKLIMIITDYKPKNKISMNP